MGMVQLHGIDPFPADLHYISILRGTLGQRQRGFAENNDKLRVCEISAELWLWLRVLRKSYSRSFRSSAPYVLLRQVSSLAFAQTHDQCICNYLQAISHPSFPTSNQMHL